MTRLTNYGGPLVDAADVAEGLLMKGVRWLELADSAPACQISTFKHPETSAVKRRNAEVNYL